MKRVLAVTLLLVAPLAIAQSEKKPACPMHAQHMARRSPDGSAEHGAKVDQRHDTFGMSHATTRHAFRLFKDGGAIELRASNATEQKTVAAIRNHIAEIAAAFARNDFTTPAFVHGATPAGIPEMQRLYKKITYTSKELPEGAAIRITTRNPAALSAVHEFMKFQIIEHRTGDSGKVE